MSVRVVHHYKHFSTMCVITGGIDMEVHYKAEEAGRALSEIKPILKLGLCQKTNVMCARLFVLSRLFYGAPGVAEIE